LRLVKRHRSGVKVHVVNHPSAKAELRPIYSSIAGGRYLKVVNHPSAKAELRPATRHGAMTGGAGGVPLRSNTERGDFPKHHALRRGLEACPAGVQSAKSPVDFSGG
jgi:hypothetical protein